MLNHRKGQSVVAALVAMSWSFGASAQSLGASASAETSVDTEEGAAGSAEAESEGDAAESEEETVAVVEEAPAPAPAPQPVVEPAPVVAAPAPVEASDAPEEKKETDHAAVVGSLGVGLLSVAQIQNITAGLGTQTNNIPVLGARYWLTERLGVQAGFGFSANSGVSKDDIPDSSDIYDLTRWNLAFHGAAPISIFSGAHYNFVVIPELNLGYSTGRTKDNEGVTGDQGFKQAAWMFGGGVKAGAEVQFGFIGIPHLSLQGSVGLEANYRTAMIETFENGEEVRRNRQWFTAGTANFNEPWDLFIGSIAALYYFDL